MVRKIYNPKVATISSTASAGDSIPSATARSSCGNLALSLGSESDRLRSRSSCLNLGDVTIETGRLRPVPFRTLHHSFAPADAKANGPGEFRGRPLFKCCCGRQ